MVMRICRACENLDGLALPGVCRFVESHFLQGYSRRCLRLEPLHPLLLNSTMLPPAFIQIFVLLHEYRFFNLLDYDSFCTAAELVLAELPDRSPEAESILERMIL